MTKLTSLPPLNPLHVFEVAGRLESFTHAARELNVTQSAVSRQIATLESYLNVKLFLRERDGISLTKAGEQYRREINQAFGIIQSATSDLRNFQTSDPLHLKVWRTLATQWLIPRLGQFYNAYPEIKLQIEPTGVPVDFSREPFNAAIQYGKGAWEGCTARMLFSEVLQPVCSPEFFKEHGDQIKTEADLMKFRLLATKMKVDDWNHWFEAKGCDVACMDPMDFPTSNMCYQAAASSIGIAMGQDILLTNFLMEKKLVRLFGSVRRAEHGYYLIWPDSISPSAKLKTFTRWIVDEA